MNFCCGFLLTFLNSFILKYETVNHHFQYKLRHCRVRMLLQGNFSQNSCIHLQRWFHRYSANCAVPQCLNDEQMSLLYVKLSSKLRGFFLPLCYVIFSDLGFQFLKYIQKQYGSEKARSNDENNRSEIFQLQFYAVDLIKKTTLTDK